MAQLREEELRFSTSRHSRRRCKPPNKIVIDGLCRAGVSRRCGHQHRPRDQHQHEVGRSDGDKPAKEPLVTSWQWNLQSPPPSHGSVMLMRVNPVIGDDAVPASEPADTTLVATTSSIVMFRMLPPPIWRAKPPPPP